MDWLWFPRTDAKQKVTGEARYTGDIRLPDMLCAKILRPPVHGAKLKSVDTRDANKVKGIQVVQDNDLIAVLYRYPDEAEKALEMVHAEYELPQPKVDNSTIFDHLLDAAPPREVVTESGNLDTGRKLAARTFESAYLNHYVAHAPIETHKPIQQSWISRGARPRFGPPRRPHSGLRRRLRAHLGLLPVTCA